MRKNSFILFLPTLSILIIMLLSGCTMSDGEDGVSGPDANKLFVINAVALFNDNPALDKADGIDSFLTISVSFDNANNIPSVSVDSVDVPIDIESFIETGHLVADRDDIPYPDDYTLTLSVAFTNQDGETEYANAVVNVPDTFSIDDTIDNFSIDYSDTIVVEWTPSTRLTDYMAFIDLSYSWLDTLGETRQFIYYNKINTDDTFLKIPATEIYPDTNLIDEVETFIGHINLYAVYGPYLNGTGSNIIGNASGTFSVLTYGGTEIFGNGPDPSLINIEPYDSEKLLELMNK